MNLKGLLNGLARRQAVWLVRIGVHGIENSVLFAVESELQEQFGSAPPKPATALPPPPARTIVGRARDGLAEPLSHSDSQRLLPIDALDFSRGRCQYCHWGSFCTIGIRVPSACLDFAAAAFQPEPLIPSP
jgi:hypothetical protein